MLANNYAAFAGFRAVFVALGWLGIGRHCDGLACAGRGIVSVLQVLILLRGTALLGEGDVAITIFAAKDGGGA